MATRKRQPIQAIPSSEEVAKIQRALAQATLIKWMGVVCGVIPIIAIVIFATTLLTNPLLLS